MTQTTGTKLLYMRTEKKRNENTLLAYEMHMYCCM